MILNLLGQDTAREPMTVADGAGPRGREAAGRAVGQPDGRVPVRRRAGHGAGGDRRGRRERELADGGRRRTRRSDVGGPRAAQRPLPRAARGRATAPSLRRERPVLLVDLGDNIGGGSAGDGTVLLAELLRQTGDGLRRGAARPGGGRAGAGGRRRRRVRGDRRRCGRTDCTATRSQSAAW